MLKQQASSSNSTDIMTHSDTLDDQVRLKTHSHTPTNGRQSKSQQSTSPASSTPVSATIKVTSVKPKPSKKTRTEKAMTIPIAKSRAISVRELPEPMVQMSESESDHPDLSVQQDNSTESAKHDVVETRSQYTMPIVSVSQDSRSNDCTSFNTIPSFCDRKQIYHQGRQTSWYPMR